MRRISVLLIALLCLLGVLACGQFELLKTATPTATVVPSVVPTETPTPGSTETPTSAPPETPTSAPPTPEATVIAVVPIATPTPLSGYDLVIEYYVDDESFCIFTGHTVDLVQTTVGQEEDVWLSAGIDKFCFAKGELTPYERINPGFYSGRVLYLLVDAKSASFCVGSDYSMDLVVSVVVEGDWYNFERLGYLHYCAGEENIEEQFLEMFTPQGEDI